MNRSHHSFPFLAPFILGASIAVPGVALAASDATEPSTPTDSAAPVDSVSEPAVAVESAEPPAEPVEPPVEPPEAIAEPLPPEEPPSPEPVPAPTVAAQPATAKAAPVADSADTAEEAEPTAEELRKSGAHLRPKRESELLKDHKVDVSKASYRPGLGLEFKSTDGRFALAMRLRAQFRYTLNHDGEESDTTHGIQIRRARLQFKGHFWNEHNKFKTEVAISPRDIGLTDGSTGRTPILDWYLDFTYLRDLSFRIGQYKLPYSRQRVVSSGDLQLVDRSIANAEFNIDRDIGFDLHSKDLLGLGHLRYNAGVYMGEGRDQYQTDTFEMLYVGRIEVLPFGMFKDYKEADFERSLKPRVSLGLGYAYMDGGKRNRGVIGSAPTDGGTTDYHNATVDLVFKIAGFSVFSDFFFREGKRKYGDATMEDDMGMQVPADREAARDGIGWSAQAGYLLPRTSFEIAGRYGQTRKTEDESGVSDRDEAGGGLNYYFAGHPMKLQLDYFARWLDVAGDKTDHQVRLQLQAAF